VYKPRIAYWRMKDTRIREKPSQLKPTIPASQLANSEVDHRYRREPSSEQKKHSAEPNLNFQPQN
jgi:hypothetical protein